MSVPNERIMEDQIFKLKEKTEVLELQVLALQKGLMQSAEVQRQVAGLTKQHGDLLTKVFGKIEVLTKLMDSVVEIFKDMKKAIE